VIGWLLMIARARALDTLRAREARPDAQRPVALPDLPATGRGQEAVMLSNESVAMVRDALGQLAEPFRIPLELAYYDGLSQSEIAARLDQPLGTVKTRMRTAISRLRDLLFTGEPR
jgi:RNA polymerase sigma-70 factor (ECF subfamily)